MGVTEKTAILVISFGTSYEETRKKTIELNQISKSFGQRKHAPNSGSGTESTSWILMRQ